jgi:serine/threonine protein kinase
MEPTSVEAVCNLLVKGRLFGAPEVRTLHQRWKTEAGASADDRTRFAKWLVANRYVTDYQAGLLLKGHVAHFFIDDYKLLDRIGAGRFAGVYQGMHRLGQMVALKVLPPSKVKDPEIFGRFQREARLARKLKHPNVVRTFHTGVADGLHYIVMEYLDGETLEEVLERRKRLPPAEAVRLIYLALLGLQHLHDNDMIHRDLKPANLMLVPGRKPGQPDTTAPSKVKILDIGLGRALFDEGEPGTEQINLTTEGSVLGTPDYMAPEQARDARGADIRSDIYSLGCVLYHCLAGQPPFADKNTVKVMIRHASEPPKPLREYNPAVPDGVQQLVNIMLAKDPSQRFPTPEQAAKACRACLEAGMAPPPQPEADGHSAAYLQWVESSTAEPTGGPGSAAAAPALGPSGPNPVQPPMTPVSVGPVLLTPAASGVELVPLAPPVQGTHPGAILGLDKGVWLWIGIAVGVAVVGGGVGWLISQALRPGN